MLRWMGAIDDNTLVVTSGKETLCRTLILAHLHPRCRKFNLCSYEACGVSILPAEHHSDYVWANTFQSMIFDLFTFMRRLFWPPAFAPLKE